MLETYLSSNIGHTECLVTLGDSYQWLVVQYPGYTRAEKQRQFSSPTTPRFEQSSAGYHRLPPAIAVTLAAGGRRQHVDLGDHRHGVAHDRLHHLGAFAHRRLEEGAAAIGVVIDRICHFGGWSIHSGVVHDYIDPACPASDAAYAFFGWLLPPHLARSVSVG